MKKAAITGLVTLGIVAAAACGTPQDGSDVIDYRRPTAGTGGSGGGASATTTGAGGSVTTGTGGTLSTGIGGVGGVSPPIPPGSGGVAGRPPFDGGSGGGPTTKGGTYTEAVVEAEDPPPPIAGGTLAIVGQGHRAAVSDPDNDQVVVVDLDTMTIASAITLAHGDEPGRLVEDGDGRLHVALRGGRGVAVLDPATNAVLGRLPVCGHPRGVAYDAGHGAIHVACVGGELVSYAASTGALLRKVRLERDLRDVVVDGDRLLVSRFRAAELLVVESNGTVTGKISPPLPPPGKSPIPRIAAVAWRTVASPDGGALMVYQLIGNSFVQTTPGGYGGGCGGIITTAISVLRTDGSTATVDNIPAVLPVDVATNPTREAAVASAAWTPGATNPSLGWFFAVTPPIPSPTHPRNSVACVATGGPPPPIVDFEAQPQGRVVALAYGPNNQIVLQTREPATVMFGDQTVTLPGRSRKHTGHELFHLGTMGGLACASCHPEGREDGQVWNFAALGPRRTQSIRGGIRGTEPFHWSGDMKDFSTLAHDVFNSRMTGPSLTDAHIESLLNWIDKIPRMEAPAVEDAAAVERGRTLFNDGNVGCASCHAGEKLTNNTTVSVGTSGAFQVPSLVGVAWRAPYMHTGCAPTLQERFGTCGGGDAHGHTSALSGDQMSDLIAYLDTL